MKWSAIIAGTLAALAVAAPSPAPEPSLQNGVDLFQNGQRTNKVAFRQQDLNYLWGINSLDFDLFQRLDLNNNFNTLQFQSLFNSQLLTVDALLHLQRLSTVLQIASTGVFNTVDLSTLNLGVLNLGQISGIGNVDLRQFIGG